MTVYSVTVFLKLLLVSILIGVDTEILILNLKNLLQKTEKSYLRRQRRFISRIRLKGFFELSHLFRLLNYQIELYI